MSRSPPTSPARGTYGPMPATRDTSLAGRPQYSVEKASSYLSSGRPATSGGVEHVQGAPIQTSVLSQSAGMHENGLGVNGIDEEPNMNRDESVMSRPMSQAQPYSPTRQGTLKKKASIKRQSSMKRTLSRKSSHAGSIRDQNLGEKEAYQEHPDRNSPFYCPVPTSGNPTEILASRFQAWRAVLKNLINYYREIQKSYEARSKTLSSASNALNSTTVPPNFMASGGLGDATQILRDFHKQALAEANKSKDVENEVIMQLTGLRSDLQQKIKEIKGLSGDFKNSVDKEQSNTKSAMAQYQEALGLVDRDAANTSGKSDPFLVKQGVDRQLARQIEEENYLHRAYLNLESSGRELESIVVGEIQKAYNAFASILQREANEAFETAEKLKGGPLAMPKDHEWDNFVTHSQQMVDPRAPVRSLANITYAGKDHPAAIDVKSGMLERKSKYLKNYTPGWYILSTTHLHEFKSADRISSQTPIMSLYLPEQKLGSHSEPGSSSHKFMLKGSQAGGMHRGHAWVFRAESHDTMMAWFSDIKELTEKKGEERNAFIRRTHARSLSGNLQKPPSIGSGNSIMQEDEADAVPYSTEQSVRGHSVPREGAEGGLLIGGVGAAAAVDDDNRSEAGWRPPAQRPSPGGRFPSNVDVNRGLQQAPMSPSSGESDRGVLAEAGALPGSGVPFNNTGSMQPHSELQTVNNGVGDTAVPPASATYTPGQHPQLFQQGGDGADSQYGEWMAPIAGATGGAALGAGAMHHHYNKDKQGQALANDESTAVPARGTSSAPIGFVGAEDHDRSLSRPRGLTESTQATATTHGASQYGAGTSSVGGATLSTVPTSIAATEETEKPTGTGAGLAATAGTTGPTVPGAVAPSAIPASIDARHGPSSPIVETNTFLDQEPEPTTTAPVGTYKSTTGMFDADGVYTGPRTENADSANPTDFVVRPVLASGDRSKSVHTISELHVPGEFPGDSRAGSTAGMSFEAVYDMSGVKHEI